jgi:hypothetical protein
VIEHFSNAEKIVITDEMIERAAKAAWEEFTGPVRKQEWSPRFAAWWAPVARAALEAALKGDS